MTTHVFIECDAHPATGGPHVSRGLLIGRYFDHPANLVMCTFRSLKHDTLCGAVILEPDPEGESDADRDAADGRRPR